MGVVQLRSDTDRYVLFLENPTSTYRGLDGSVRDRFDNQVGKFMTEATPSSALQAEEKFPTPLRQLKDRNSKARALGTWCKGEGFDLFIVQVIYHKDDESKFLPRKHEFANRGSALKERFESFTAEEMGDKAKEWMERDDLRLMHNYSL